MTALHKAPVCKLDEEARQPAVSAPHLGTPLDLGCLIVSCDALALAGSILTLRGTHGREAASKEARAQEALRHTMLYLQEQEREHQAQDDAAMQVPCFAAPTNPEAQTRP